MTELAQWTSFYVIVGSSAGALIGLQFVVVTLIGEKPPVGAAEAGAAFSTPSVVHFCAVLLLSAVLSAPWSGTGTAAIVWGFVGLSGIVYAFVVVRRMRVQTAYKPVFEDWLFHCLLPCASYLTLFVSAVLAAVRPRPALFLIAAATLLLLFIGIHNAWDAVTYFLLVHRTQERDDDDG